MATARHRRCGIYARISFDPSGARLGVQRQLKECQVKAADRGWTVFGTYEDNDVSASTGRARPEYQRMLADLEAGIIDAVVVWDLDRLTRRPIEIEAFIDLADRKKVALASVGGDVDLATDNGRMFARIKGAVARAEVERKSARQKAANEQRASAGRPHIGRRAFGYDRDGVAMVHSEAREVKRAADRLVRGDSLRAITADFNERGVVTTAGGAWRPTEVRRMLANPRYAGVLTRHGDVIGDGAWQPILDRGTHAAIVATFAAPERHRAGPAVQHLLSGIAHCGVCGARVYGVTEKGKGAVYRCETRAHVTRRGQPIDELVVKVVLERLSRPDAIDILPGAEVALDLNDLRGQDAALRTRLGDVAAAFAEGEIDRAQMAKASAAIRDRLEEVSTRLLDAARVPVLAGIIGADSVATVWEVLSFGRHRAIIDTLMTVAIDRAGRGKRSFDPGSVRLAWRS